MIRPPRSGDANILVEARDEVWERWLGPGSDSPNPTACILMEERIVGWVDYDFPRPWLEVGEVNVGYGVFAPDRGHGYGTRGLLLLVHHLAVSTEHHTATASIDAGNYASLALARRAGFRLERTNDDGSWFLARRVEPLSTAYTLST